MVLWVILGSTLQGQSSFMLITVEPFSVETNFFPPMNPWIMSSGKYLFFSMLSTTFLSSFSLVYFLQLLLWSRCCKFLRGFPSSHWPILFFSHSHVHSRGVAHHSPSESLEELSSRLDVAQLLILPGSRRNINDRIVKCKNTRGSRRRKQWINKNIHWVKSAWRML